MNKNVVKCGYAQASLYNPSNKNITPIDCVGTLLGRYCDRPQGAFTFLGR